MTASIAPTETTALATRLAEAFLETPQKIRRLARDLGLWSELREVLAEMLWIAHARLDPNEFIEYAIPDNEGDRTSQASFHREWQQKMTDSSSLLIGAPRGHGKCNVAGTRLALADGSRIKVEDMPVGKDFDVLSWTTAEGYSTQKARMFEDKVQPSVEIRTKSGRATRYSVEHPCWMGEGWVRAEDVKPGQKFAVARLAPTGTVEYPKHLAYLLGALLGDGGLTIDSRVRVTIHDAEVLRRVEAACALAGFSVTPGTDKGAYSIVGYATRWIRGFGLDGCGSHTKFVPKEVFMWDEEALAAFVEGYFDTDGCVSVAAKVIEFSSVNREMLLDVQSLLLRLGVVTNLRLKNGTYKGERHVSWRLQIAGGSTANFVDCLTSNTERAARARKIADVTFVNSNIDLVPEEVLNRLEVRRGCRTDKRDGCDLSNRRPRGHVRDKVLRLASKQGRQDLANEANLFWDEVVEVVELGLQKTYSVEVDNTHVHVTDDFITHNTIQVSSRLIWEIGKRVTIRIKIVSAKDKAAETILGMIKAHIESNPLVRKVFPHLEIDVEAGDTQSAFFVKRPVIMRDPTCVAAGVMTAAAGGRADILVCDDVCDETNSVVNPAMRVKVLSILRNVWFALRAPKSKLWWLCTPYHIEDATHVLRRGDDGSHVFQDEWWTPAITSVVRTDEHGQAVYDEDGAIVYDHKVLWPEFWSYEALMEKKAAGVLAFTRQYLLKVQSDEDLTFPPETLAPSYDALLWKIGQALPFDGPEGNIPDSWPTFGGIDLAASMNIKGAFTVIWTIAYCPENKRLYLKDMVRKKIKFHEVMREIEAAFDRHKWQYALVENNAFQQSVITQLDEFHKHIPIEGVHTGINKNDSKIGLPGMSAAISKGLFVIPARDVGVLSENDTTPFGIFWNELTNHPGAKFSDTVMSLWFAYRAYIATLGTDRKNYGALCSGE